MLPSTITQLILQQATRDVCGACAQDARRLGQEVLPGTAFVPEVLQVGGEWWHAFRTPHQPHRSVLCIASRVYARAMDEGYAWWLDPPAASSPSFPSSEGAEPLRRGVGRPRKVVDATPDATVSSDPVPTD